ncbi:MAG: hypothetical protein AB7O37_00555 [Vicinamibacteria bacterium]
MVELLSELLLILLEFVAEFFGEVLLELGLSGLKEAFGRRNRSPYLATVGYLILGLGVGWLSAMMFPEPVFRSGRLPGVSLPIAFFGGGSVMHLWGLYRRSRGHSPTNLATFHGGGIFALAVAFVRFVYSD